MKRLVDTLKKKGMTKLPEQVVWVRRPEILLCVNIPKPLSEVNPRSILGLKWWNATRKAAYKSTDEHCIACGVAKSEARSRAWLEGHEVYEINYKRGISKYIETVPLCHFCHNYIHDGRMKQMLLKGQLHHAKYVNVILHGDRVLKDAGLSRLTHEEREQQFILMELAGEVAPWHKWRLLLNGKKYSPKYKTLEAWMKHYA